MWSIRVIFFIILSGLAGALWGCAGPTTPLGAVIGITPAQVAGHNAQEYAPSLSAALSSATVDFTRALTLTPLKPEIRFYPAHQSLHRSAPVTIEIHDPNGVEEGKGQFFVRYNGVDVTESFIQQAKIEYLSNEGKIIVYGPRIRLSPSEDHRIEWVYRSDLGAFAHANYEPPRCSAFQERKILRTGDFKPSQILLNLIDRLAKEHGYNPGFVAALIAQESGFNPHRVSWAKAIGLTQVTSVAEKEVSSAHQDWPRYSGIEDMSVLKLKLLIAAGMINSHNEWRLDRNRSIEGALDLTQILEKRWNQVNRSGARGDKEADETFRTKLLLASYNSGFSRVQGALAKRNGDWLSSRELREAKRYVNQIFSYCDQFVDQESPISD